MTVRFVFSYPMWIVDFPGKLVCTGIGILFLRVLRNVRFSYNKSRAVIGDEISTVC